MNINTLYLLRNINDLRHSNTRATESKLVTRLRVLLLAFTIDKKLKTAINPPSIRYSHTIYEIYWTLRIFDTYQYMGLKSVLKERI